MALTEDVIQQFVAATNDSSKSSNGTTCYGTVVIDGGYTYVRLDGSTLLTPVITTAKVLDGERVTVLLKNHTATITGNISAPSASNNDMEAVTQTVDNLKLKSVTTEQLEATNAKIANLETTKLSAEQADLKYASVESLEAVEAKIDDLDVGNLDAKYATIESLDAVEAKIDALDVGNLDAKYATIESLETTNGKITTLESDNVAINKKLTAAEADISTLEADNVTVNKKLTAAEANISTLEADNVVINETLTALNAEVEDLSASQITTEYLEANFANISLANVAVADIGTLFANVGLITSATIQNGHITGYLDSVEVNANKITAGTLAVDRLIFRGNNSIIYELNNITGALQAVQGNTLNGEILTDRSITVDKIVANSITANEIASGAITADEIASRTITADKLVANSLTANEIKSGAIGTDELAANAVTAGKIAANAITADKILAGAITADKLDVDEIFSNSAVVNKIFAQDITATGTITGATLKGAYVEADSGNIGKLSIDEDGVLTALFNLTDDIYTDDSVALSMVNDYINIKYNYQAHYLESSKSVNGTSTFGYKDVAYSRRNTYADPPAYRLADDGSSVYRNSDLSNVSYSTDGITFRREIEGHSNISGDVIDTLDACIKFSEQSMYSAIWSDMQLYADGIRLRAMGYIHINSTEITVKGLLDVEDIEALGSISANSITTGTIHITNPGDAAGAAAGTPGFMIGPSTGAHIVIDNNEIIAKANETTGGTLALQYDTGTGVTIGSTGKASSLYVYGSIATSGGANLDTVNSRTTWRTCTLTASSAHGHFNSSGPGRARCRYNEQVIEVDIKGIYVVDATVAEGQAFARVTNLPIRLPAQGVGMMWDDTAQIMRRVYLGADGYLKLASNASIPTNYWLSLDTCRFVIFRTSG